MSDEMNNNSKEDFEYNALELNEISTEDENTELVPNEENTDLEAPTSSGVHEDTTTDYEEARKTYYELVKKGQKALNNLLEVAESSEHPRSYEVLSQLIKSISDTNDRIVELQDKMRKIEKMDNDMKSASEKEEKNVTNNTVFVGSMNDFQQYLKSIRNQDYSERNVTNEE